MSKLKTVLLIVSLCACILAAKAATITQSFSASPQADGWKIFGNTNQFHLDTTNLDVTWDSAQNNSYYYHSLGTTVARSDDFKIEFDLLLKDIASGTEPGKTGGLEIGIGLLNFNLATNADFQRGVFGAAPSLVEFDYFPAGYYDFGGMIFDVAPTATPTMISTNGFDYAPNVFGAYEFELPTNVWMHLSLDYTGTNQTLVTRVTTNGVPVAQFPDVVLNDTNRSAFTDSDDFRLDTFAICSYSSAGDDFDSVLAHGIVDNLEITFPRPIENFTGSVSNGTWQGQFSSRSNWVYTLERSANLQSWLEVSAPIEGNTGALHVQDTNNPANAAFYRMRASRP
jgi:hypothetical protein